MDDIVADEVSVLPGMEELANLLWINRHRESGDYDLIVVDCAPTGETLRLLSFPEIGRWWVEKILPIQRAAVGVMRPIVRATTGMPMPTDDVYTTVQELFGQLDRLHDLAELYNNQGRFEEARTLYQQALAIREQILGPTHSDTAKSLAYHRRITLMSVISICSKQDLRLA